MTERGRARRGPRPGADRRPLPTTVAGLRDVLRSPGFRRLLTVRLIGQGADGLLQVALASFVFFSPERAASPGRVALGLAVLLLPFSLIGPFTGVVIDRWSRRQVLLVANLTRVAGLVVFAGLVAAGREGPAFYLVALGLLGVNRFILAGLGAALPHVVRRRRLVVANAVSPTSGTLATVVGAAVGFAIQAQVADADRGSALVVLAAAVGCALAALAALRLHRHQLGPDRRPTGGWRAALAGAGHDVVAGVRHVHRRPPAARALAVMTGHRFLYGIATVTAILLFRNTFFPDDADAALAGLGAAVLAAGAGIFVGAALTPPAVARIGESGTVAVALVLAATGQLAGGLPFTAVALTAGSFALGVAAQSVKVVVDATVQRSVADRYRGRAFTLYDLLFNTAYVAAAAVGAALLPESGRAPAVFVALALGYLALAAWYPRRRG